MDSKGNQDAGEQAVPEGKPAIITATRELIRIANETHVDVSHAETNPDKDFIYQGLFLMKLYTHIQNQKVKIDKLLLERIEKTEKYTSEFTRVHENLQELKACRDAAIAQSEELEKELKTLKQELKLKKACS